MNILFLSALPIWPSGNKRAGAPSFFRTIEAYLDTGHNIYLITPDPAALNIQKKNLHILPVLLKLNPRNSRLLNLIKIVPLFTLAALFQSLKISRSIKFDLIYGYEVHGILPGWFIKLVIRKPLVSRFQGTILYPIVSNQHATLTEKIKKIDHFLAFNVPADLAIMTDDGTYGDKVIQAINRPLWERTFFWKNGVDFDSPSENGGKIREKMGVGQDDVLLMTISRLVKWKRVDRAINALPKILEKGKKVKLMIIGDGLEKDNLCALSRKMGVERAVIFTGWVEHAQVVDYLCNADIFLSLYDLSNVGNPLLEAMRQGKPIVALQTGDTASVIQHGLTGLLVETGDADNVASAVLDLIDHPEKRAFLAENAKRYAEQHFWDWSTRLSKELEVVERLVCQRQNLDEG